jgi:hypothetical protein
MNRFTEEKRQHLERICRQRNVRRIDLLAQPPDPDLIQRKAIWAF